MDALFQTIERAVASRGDVEWAISSLNKNQIIGAGFANMATANTFALSRGAVGVSRVTAVVAATISGAVVGMVTGNGTSSQDAAGNLIGSGVSAGAAAATEASHGFSALAVDISSNTVARAIASALFTQHELLQAEYRQYRFRRTFTDPEIP